MLDTLPLPERASHRANIFGTMECHYRFYLAGRMALEVGDWDTAWKHFERSKNELLLQKHAGLIDPIRLGYINIGMARTLIGRGSAPLGKPRDLEAGLKGLLEARSGFR
jgi:hypothetical protein